MAGTNLLAPLGLISSRNLLGGAPTEQANRYKLRKGYATAIGMGDLVQTGGVGANQGYAVLAPNAPAATLGVFAGLATGYFDLTAQQQMFGLNGSWPATANPSTDVDCLIIDDPFRVFRAQVTGGPWLQSWRGQNIGFVANSNGAPNISGISTLTLDATTISNNQNLPFRIQELVGVSGGPQDPANTNPWIEVRLNLSEMLAAPGI